ncbi:hypothetical protein KUTeg_007716 [Tegillarca granosa]|uniref:Peptidase S1 domain-containing protein n=1 Tax=Tegillarca granosa TaxID=220873 RepID=A0ABQ9FHC6_TEGGR|nr:hypothetical protein KUTeg_007716 [Tegillarca granosa]
MLTNLALQNQVNAIVNNLPLQHQVNANVNNFALQHQVNDNVNNLALQNQVNAIVNNLTLQHQVNANVNNLALQYQVNANVNNLTLQHQHENYNPSGDGFPNDIAILLLDSSLTFNTYVQPAKLPESSFYPSSNCVMTGWGRNNIDNALPVTLQEAFVDPISNSQCQRAMRGIFGATIHDYHICPHNGESQIGDSGGPYSCYDGSQYVLTGVTSWGIQSNGQCSLQHPSVYVRVTHFLSWINQNKN